MSRLSVSELRAFVVAVDLGSVGRAAAALGVTQSALSKRLKSLEALAGAELLERSASGVRPSAAGRVVLADSRRLLAQADALEARMAALGSATEPVRVAASPALAELVVPAAIALLDPADQLPVELLVTNSDAVRDAVADGRADLGLAAADLDEDLSDRGTILLEDELVAVVPPDDAWAALHRVPAAELVARRLIVRDPGSHARRTLEHAAREAGLTLAPPLLEVGNPAAVKAAVRARNAPGILSRHAVDEARDGLAVRRIEGMDLRRRFWVLLGDDAGPGATRVAERLLGDAR